MNSSQKIFPSSSADAPSCSSGGAFQSEATGRRSSAATVTPRSTACENASQRRPSSAATVTPRSTACENASQRHPDGRLDATERLASSSSPSCSSLVFEPTEVPLWRTEGVYNQLWIVNRGKKTSEMLQMLESKTQPHSVRCRGLTDEEAEEAWRTRKHVLKLAQKLKNGVLTVEEIAKVHSALTGSREGYRSQLATSKPLNTGHDAIAFLKPSCIASELDNLVKFYNSKRKECVTLREHFKLAAYFGSALTCIHPFGDGNGRLVRVLLPAFMLCFLGGKDPVFLCGRSIASSRRLVMLHSLEQTNKTWSVTTPVESLNEMLVPEGFCAFLIEAACGTWDITRLPDKLPPDLVPKQYNLSLKINVEKKTLQGEACIQLEARTDTRIVQIHSDSSLDIHSVSALSSSKILGSRFWKEDGRLFVTISEAANAENGKLILVIKYSAHLKSYDRSFEHEGERRAVYILNPCPGFARYTFPCWDEPRFKVSFSLKINRPLGMTVLSNMDSLAADSQVVGFFPSTPLSAEQLCLVVGHLREVRAITLASGMIIRVYAQDGGNDISDEDISDAFNLITNLIRFYEEYFSQEYPLKKLDVVLLPGEYNAAALGCIVLSDVKKLRDVAVLLASLWLGNLVKTSWWSYSWLDLGLSLVAEFAIRELYPQSSDFHFQQETADLIRSKPSTPLQIEMMSVYDYHGVDLRTAAKRSVAILSMLQSSIGPEKFKESLRVLVSSRKNSTYSPDDFWALLPSIGDCPVDSIMKSSWLDSTSFPVLEVSLTTATSISFKQRSIFGDEQGLWTIPFCCRWGLSGREEKIETQYMIESETLVIDTPAEIEWIRVSVGEYNCCSVEYDEATLKLLCEGVRSKKLAITDRIGAIWNASFAGTRQLDAILQACEGETDEQVLSAREAAQRDNVSRK